MHDVWKYGKIIKSFDEDKQEKLANAIMERLRDALFMYCDDDFSLGIDPYIKNETEEDSEIPIIWNVVLGNGELHFDHSPLYNISFEINHNELSEEEFEVNIIAEKDNSDEAEALNELLENIEIVRNGEKKFRVTIFPKMEKDETDKYIGSKGLDFEGVMIMYDTVMIHGYVNTAVIVVPVNKPEDEENKEEETETCQK